jgi:hypothetical protein
MASRSVTIALLLHTTLCIAAAMAQEAAAAGEWKSLFDGTSLRGWRETAFTDRGKVAVEDRTIVLGMGAMTGITRTESFPKSNYEVRLEALRIEGSDFFAGITFPFKESHCSWIVGGWGGGIVGLSNLDGHDASENETAIARQFENGRWYSLLLRVTDDWIEAWIDEEKVIEVETGGRKITVRPGEIELSRPFGIASWSTSSRLRKLEYRVLTSAAAKN